MAEVFQTKLGFSPEAAAVAARTLSPIPFVPRNRHDKRTVQDARRELRRQEGVTLKQHQRMGQRESNDPRVKAALEAQDRAVLELARDVKETGLRITPAIFEARHRAIREQWNALVDDLDRNPPKGNKPNACTLMRYCEECGAAVVYRHRLSRHCSDKCKQTAKDRRRAQRRK